MTHINRLGERVMVAGSGCAVVGGIVAFDGTMRGQIGKMMTGEGLGELAIATATVQRTLHAAMETAGYQSGENASLTVFAIAALVLFIAMLKT